SGADRCRRDLPGERISGSNGDTEAAESREPNDVVHDVVDGACGVIVAIQRAGRHCGGIADSKPAGTTVGGDDWIFCELVGDANTATRRNERAGVAERGAQDGAASVFPSGYSV